MTVRDARAADLRRAGDGERTLLGPGVPDLPGSFDGASSRARLPHSRPFAGQRVVVVGGSQSALDIAAEVATTAAADHVLSCREGHHLLPRHVFGPPLDEFDRELGAGRCRCCASCCARCSRAGRATPDRGNLPATRATGCSRPAGRQSCRPQAAARPERARFRVPAGISRLAGDRVVFSDGSEAAADAVIFATGYRINFPALPAELGRGSGWQFPLYRRILSPHAEGLASSASSSRVPACSRSSSARASGSARCSPERVALPPRDRMWQVDRRRERAPLAPPVRGDRTAHDAVQPARLPAVARARPAARALRACGALATAASPRPRSPPSSGDRGSRVTTTIVETGRASPNTSACAAPTASPSAGSVMNMRVRTTSPGLGARLAQRGRR